MYVDNTYYTAFSHQTLVYRVMIWEKPINGKARQQNKGDMEEATSAM